MLSWILGGAVGGWLGFLMFHTALSTLVFAILGGALGSAIVNKGVVAGKRRRGDGSGASGDGDGSASSDGDAACGGSDGGGDGGGGGCD